MTPKKFFVVSGKASSSVSELNAFDEALVKAGIAQCNLVPVSSILPKGAEQVEPFEILPGSITYLVLARMDGKQGETIGAGIAWAMGEKHGIVVEEHDHDNESIGKELYRKLMEMGNIRGLKVSNYEMRIESMKVEDKYGCVLAALVFVPE
jgi:arginine decarboxylase